MSRRDDLDDIQLVATFFGMAICLVLGGIIGAAISNTHWSEVCEVAKTQIKSGPPTTGNVSGGYDLQEIMKK